MESKKKRITQEYEDLMARIRDASLDSSAYQKYAGVLDVASQTVGQITHGLQGIRLL